MRAIVYDEFRGPLSLATVSDPRPTNDGVVIRVTVTGLCRSDWHGWMGHDADIQLPHVPGHEFAGKIMEVGAAVKRFRVGQRVTVPFSVGCGTCRPCQEGQLQVCDNYFQPGFTAFGSFADYVAIPHADINLISLPTAIDDATAAVLGCRYATAFHAIANQVTLQPEQWLAVHGCGGVGLAVIQIARAFRAKVIAVDTDPKALQLAIGEGADQTVHVQLATSTAKSVGEQVRELTDGGAHVSVDAIGGKHACLQSIESLRKRGTHLQIGLMPGDAAQLAVPMARLVAEELRFVGSHGMAAHEYPRLLALIANGSVRPQNLIRRRLPLAAAVDQLPKMHGAEKAEPGVVVFNI